MTVLVIIMTGFFLFTIGFVKFNSRSWALIGSAHVQSLDIILQDRSVILNYLDPKTLKTLKRDKYNAIELLYSSENARP